MVPTLGGVYSALKLALLPFMFCMRKLFWNQILNTTARFMSRGNQKGRQNSEAANKEFTKEFFQIENQVKSYKTVKDNTKDIQDHKIQIEALIKDTEAFKKENQAQKYEIESIKNTHKSEIESIKNTQ